MLCVKAHHVLFVMADGREVARPARDAMMHDEDGEGWPYCSVLVGPYARGTGAADLSTKAQRYFGRGYRARRGEVDLPPRDLSAWKCVGPVRRIFYVRHGDVFGGKPFKHRFGDRWLWIFKRRQVATLYTHGRFARLELPGGCIVNWRGFVTP